MNSHQRRRMRRDKKVVKYAREMRLIQKTMDHTKLAITDFKDSMLKFDDEMMRNVPAMIGRNARLLCNFDPDPAVCAVAESQHIMDHLLGFRCEPGAVVLVGDIPLTVVERRTSFNPDETVRVDLVLKKKVVP